jgi:hypothetical protein
LQLVFGSEAWAGFGKQLHSAAALTGLLAAGYLMAGERPCSCVSGLCWLPDGLRMGTSCAVPRPAFGFELGSREKMG